MELIYLTKDNKKDIMTCLRSNTIYNKLSNEDINESDAEEMLTCHPTNTDIKQKVLFGAIVDNICIGIADVIYDYPEKKHGFIGLLMIHQEVHGKHYGETFYKLIEKLLFEKGMDRIYLGVLLQNEKGYLFWKKQGFKTIEIRKRKDTSLDIDVYYMEKKLKTLE